MIAPIEPERLSRGRVIALCVMLYCLYVVGCLAMEQAARQRFVSRPARGAAAAQPLSQRERLHEELRQLRERQAMESWPPYVWYEAAVVGISCLGSLACAYAVVRALLRNRSSDFLVKAKLGALGAILGAALGFFLLFWPALAADQILKALSR